LGYLPLDFIIQSNNYADGITKIIMEELVKHGMPEMSREDLIKFLFRMSDNDGDIVSDARYRSSYDAIIPVCSSTLIHNGYMDLNGRFLCDAGQILTEVEDSVLAPFLIENWADNKQVYKPDEDFCEALIKTENVTLTKEMVTHLPCTNFFLDFTNTNIFYPIAGVFVDVHNYGDKCYITTYSIDRKLTMWSFYYHFDLSKGDKVLKAEDYRLHDVAFDLSPYDIMERGVKKIESTYSRGAITFFVIQLLAYMTSHEPQIEENPITRNTYKKPKTKAEIKNKFKEVQMWDVGVKYGTTFRQIKKANPTIRIVSEEESKELVKRKSPVPHFRSAHWQRYWVGEGRTKCVNKWLEPTFVGGNTVKDTIIHRIKK